MRHELPTGTVTFLFTDIEGSTRLVEALGPTYRGVLEGHAAILRQAITNHRGIEISTEGDAFFAVFGSASDAVDAAVDAQRHLAEEPWPEGRAVRVRMGLHTGEGHLGGDSYVGLDVHRAARIAAAGHGGQVLVSTATRTLVEAVLPDGTTFRDLGSHRLKDLSQPEHLAQLVIDGLRADFPPPRSLGPYRTNLPVELTSFVGRKRELNGVIGLAAGHRLVTLLGVGGTGKTRLMLRAGTELLPGYEDGVWLTDLAPIADPDLVRAQVARALGIGDEPRRDPVETLLDYLRGKSILILLDNCEHVIAAAGDLIERILANCPSTALLASSREALGVAGEAIYQVPSLSLPRPSAPLHGHRAQDAGDDGPSAELGLDAAAASEAVRLFVERAQAVLPEFGLTAANAAAVIGICRRLDGIPLAIELAAARVTVLSVDEIEAGLGDRFRLLTGGRRGALPRQRTLQALIDWSWDLLTDLDKVLLARLSVFARDWTLDAAATIVAIPDRGSSDRIATLDGLGRLVERSLVVVERREATRYGMLETIRQYARDRLIASGEVGPIHEAHLSFFLDLALQAEQPLLGPDMAAWLRRLDTEVDNLRAAIDWGIEADPERAIRLTIALVSYWRSRAFGSEAVDLIVFVANKALSLPPPMPAAARDRTILVSRILAAAAHAENVWGSGSRAPGYAERAVALAREADDPVALLEAMSAQAMSAVFSGHHEDLMAMHDAVIRLAEARGNAWYITMIEAGAALFELGSGDVAAADRRLERASDAAFRSGNPSAIAFAVLNRGRVAGSAGRLDEARAWFDQAMERYREIGDHRFELIARSDLAHALRRGGALDEAEDLYRITILAWEHLGSRGAIANQLEAFGFLAVARGEPERAARLLGSAEALRETAGTVMLRSERLEYDDALGRLRAGQEPIALEATWGTGRALSMDEAIKFAIVG